MASFDTTLRFNWNPQPTMWQEIQIRNAKQADILDAESTTAAITSKLTNASANRISGVGNLAAKAALTRIKAATAAKQKQQQDAAERAQRDAPPTSNTPSDVTLSDGTVIKASSSITLAGGTKINPADNTMTLSDGTLISLLTGRKVEKVDTTA
jgi:type IV secretory pathway VirB10-like protein